MSKTYKGDVTGNVVELNLLDANEGTLPNLGTPTVVTLNTGPNAVEQIVGDIPASQYLFSSAKGLVIGTSCTSIGSSAFNYSFSLNSQLVIPDSVTSIGSYAFADTTIVGDLVIPNSVTTIGDYAFGFCNSLTALYTNIPAASWVGTNALVNTAALVNIYEGPDVTGQYSATFQGGSGMTVSAWTNYPNIP